MSEESETAFGIVDVVEAFTAMRHELKLQGKEGRKLVAAVEQAVARLEGALVAQATAEPSSNEPSTNDRPSSGGKPPADVSAASGPAAKAWAEAVAADTSAGGF